MARRGLQVFVVVACSAVLAAASSVACGDSSSPASEPSGPGPSGDPSPNPGDKGGGDKPDPVDTNPDEPWNPPSESGSVAFPYTAYRCGYAIRQVSPSKQPAIFHAEAGSAAPKNLHLTIAGNASSSVVVQWATDDATTSTELRFGESPDKLDKIAHGFSFEFGSARREHEVHLCGLKPGKTYYYDAGGAAARSKGYKFTTAPDAATNVTILVGGDTRSNPSVWGGFAQAALSHGPTMMVLTGDAVATGGNQGQWDALFGAAPDLFAQLPGIWAHGNHEALDELYFDQLALGDHGGNVGVEEWFATTYGPIRFVTLNDTVSSSSQITGVEKQFLETTLTAVDRARTPFVITSHHKPMYTTSSGHSSATDLRSAWGPLFAQHHVDLDFAGHVHSYELTEPIKAGTTTVTSDAEGTRFINFGGGGAPLYGFGAKQPWMKTRESVHGFAILEASASQMVWTAYRADGSTLETLTIPK